MLSVFQTINKSWIHLLSLLVLFAVATLSCQQASGTNQEDTEIPIIYVPNSGIEIKDASLQPGSEITFQGYNIFEQEYLSDSGDSGTYDPQYFTRMVDITITDSTIQDRSYFFDGQIIRPNYHDFPDKQGEYITTTVRIKKRLIDQKTFRGYVIDKVISLTPLKFDRKKVLTACIATLEANTERLKKEIPERIPKDWLDGTPPLRPFTENDFFQKKPMEIFTVYPDVMVDFENKKALCRFAANHSLPSQTGFIGICANIVFDLEHELPSKIFVNFILLRLE